MKNARRLNSILSREGLDLTAKDIKEGVLSKEEFLILLGLGDYKPVELTRRIIWREVLRSGRAVNVMLFQRYYPGETRLTKIKD